MYCLEQSNELRIIDTCKLPYAVTTMTWSSEYDCITVGTDQVTYTFILVLYATYIHTYIHTYIRT